MDHKNEVYDVIVVGAGIMGLYTSYTMVKKGLKVLLIDQFILPHNRGSSGGQSRIIRLFYRQEYYMDMMPEVFQLWSELEEETGKQLLAKTNFLGMADTERGREQLGRIRKMLQRKGHAHEFLHCEELRERFSMMCFSSGCVGLLDTNGGLLLVGRCNQALLDGFQKRGGVLRDGEKVSGVVPGKLVKVLTQNREYTAKKVVLTPGPWAKELLSTLGLDLPLITLPGVPSYWKEKVPGSHAPSAGMPIALKDLDVEGGYQFVAAFPSGEYPGMVKMITRGEPVIIPAGPEDRDKVKRDYLMKFLSEFVKEHLPGVEDTPSIVEACMYTRTPDGDYILDRHPEYDNILIGAGGSGHAYKMGPLIGKILTELTLGQTPSYDISRFKVNRFISKAKL